MFFAGDSLCEAELVLEDSLGQGLWADLLPRCAVLCAAVDQRFAAVG